VTSRHSPFEDGYSDERVRKQVSVDPHTNQLSSQTQHDWSVFRVWGVDHAQEALWKKAWWLS